MEKWSIDQGSSKAQIRTLLEEQRQTILAECHARVSHHENLCDSANNGGEGTYDVLILPAESARYGPSDFQQLWTSKGGFDESGPCVVHRKCTEGVSPVDL